MEKFYFTYGSNDGNHPFRGGWTEVFANDRSEAYKKFSDAHPSTEYGAPYCDMYTEDRFQRTSMSKTGNFGHGCWEQL